MGITETGLNLLIELEGKRLEAYYDAAGHLTIGVGHLLTRAELESKTLIIGNERIDWRDGLTNEQCTALLEQDVIATETAVERLVKVHLHDYQYDALISFAYNVGAPRLAESGLLEAVNSKRWQDVPTEWRKWRYATVNGKKKEINGLINRREAEIGHWQRGVAANVPEVKQSLPYPTDYVDHAPDRGISDKRRSRWLEMANPLDLLPGYGTYISIAAGLILFAIDTTGYQVPDYAYALLSAFAMYRMRRAMDWSRPYPRDPYSDRGDYLP